MTITVNVYRALDKDLPWRCDIVAEDGRKYTADAETAAEAIMDAAAEMEWQEDIGDHMTPQQEENLKRIGRLMAENLEQIAEIQRNAMPEQDLLNSITFGKRKH